MKELTLNILFSTIGAFLAAFALECFLVPNQIIDGGIVGVSIMTSYITKFNLGIVLLVLNIPFFLLGLNEFGKRFIFGALYSVSMLALFVNFFSSHFESITSDLLLASVFGGSILGLGVGIVLKNNACMDGTEILAMKISKKYPFSVGEIIMFINVFIFISAGFLYGWEQAMYSTLTYYVAYRAIDLVIQGLNEEKSIRIVTDKGYEIVDAIIKQLNKTATYFEVQGGYSKATKMMVFCVIPRIEIYKLKEIVIKTDKDAFISIGDVHEVYGKRYKQN